MSSVDLATVSTIVSIVLGVVAIVLSIVFFAMSMRLAESTQEAAKGVSASVDKLEKLFDRLYTDTFSMMRDTVSDMRKHMWPSGEPTPEEVPKEPERIAEERIAALKANVDEQLSSILRKQQVSNGKVDALRVEMQQLVARAISGSREAEAEARQSAIRAQVVQLLRSTPHGAISADDIVSRLGVEYGGSAVVEQLGKMKELGLVRYSDKVIRPATMVMLA